MLPARLHESPLASLWVWGQVRGGHYFRATLLLSYYAAWIVVCVVKQASTANIPTSPHPPPANNHLHIPETAKMDGGDI